MSLQKMTLSALSLTAVICLGLTPAFAADGSLAVAPDHVAAPVAGKTLRKKAVHEAKAPALTKEEIQKIVHDYIMENPQVLMQSVEDYQRKVMAERQANASADIKKNKGILTDPNSPEAGNPHGDVTMVEFFDYNCHFCKGAFPAVQSLIQKDKNVHVVFKEFPILGPSSEEAAKWALAAQRQKKYYAFHTAMMENKEPIDESLLERVAKNVGMDVDKAKTDVASPEIMAELNKNRALAEQLDISGTPAFIIGDDISRGAIPEDTMEQKIKEIRAQEKK